ncbi:hypothetical protein F5Y14DRAFT_428588 [Nemania sp. NC0429]|nr:hypothetical protein F5Y14DRAFT_428588 [Nemania sp. NC0429]
MFNFLLIALAGQFFLNIASIAAAAQQQCYYPKGNVAPYDSPCGDGVNHSHCCDSKSLCLSNRLCLRATPSYELSRASCTDPTWQSPQCPSLCTNVSISGGAPIALYTYSNSRPSQYCCGTATLIDGSLKCYWNPDPFTVEEGDIIADRGLLKNYIAAGSREPNSTCPVDGNCQTDTSSNAILAIGAGLGVPLGLLSTATFLWALWERRKRQSEVTKAAGWQAAVLQLGETSQPLKRETPLFQAQPYDQIAELRHEGDPVELRHGRDPVEMD